jgi:hypothetical protein
LRGSQFAAADCSRRFSTLKSSAHGRFCYINKIEKFFNLILSQVKGKPENQSKK